MLEVSTIRYICFTDDGDISKISLEKGLKRTIQDFKKLI